MSPPPGRRRDPAALAVGVRVGIRRERGGDRGEVHRVPAERRRHHRRDAGGAEDRRERRAVAEAREHAHPGDVLRRHRHDEQRQADADDRGDVEDGGDDGERRGSS